MKRADGFIAIGGGPGRRRAAASMRPPLMEGLEGRMLLSAGDPSAADVLGPTDDAVVALAEPAAQKTATQLQFKSWGPNSRTNPPLLTATILAPGFNSLSELPLDIRVPGKIHYSTATLGVQTMFFEWPANSATSGSFTISKDRQNHRDVTEILPRPTGTVTFREGPTVLGTATPVEYWLNRSIFSAGDPLECVSAVFSPKGLGPGRHAITASYSGDDNFTAAAAAFRVKVGLTPTRTTLTSSKSSVIVGDTFQLTAKVETSEPDFVIPSGHVVFMDGRKELGRVRLDGPTASIQVPLRVGKHHFHAEYIGDENCQPSRSAVMDRPVIIGPTRTRMSAVQPPAYWSSFTFTGYVDAGRHATPATGTITFMSHRHVLGTAPVAQTARFQLDFPPGTHLITAVYSGDESHLPSRSDPFQITVLRRTVPGDGLEATNFTGPLGSPELPQPRPPFDH